MTTKSSKANTKLLKAAKADIANGEASFRSAANRIASAVSSGTTQADAAKAVGKSQYWVNRLLKWRENGFAEGGPFAEDNAKKKIGSPINEVADEEPYDHSEDWTDSEVLPEHKENAFLIRADQARQFAIYSGKPKPELAEQARFVGKAWNDLADQMAEEKPSDAMTEEKPSVSSPELDAWDAAHKPFPPPAPGLVRVERKLGGRPGGLNEKMQCARVMAERTFA
jgi:hypothetical protein